VQGVSPFLPRARRTGHLRYREMASPVGFLLLAGDGEVLEHLSFLESGRAFQPGEHAVHDASAYGEVAEQLCSYFAGELRAFDVPLAPHGTEFQLAVWRELCRIPFGATASYREVAERIGRPTATRAVGAANGANPIAIIVPCHRVIGADGSLTGFGGGLAAKRLLLDHEQPPGIQRRLI
jgi:methylated-DNA-[protein]-cysteine S-methyltransferase